MALKQREAEPLEQVLAQQAQVQLQAQQARVRQVLAQQAQVLGEQAQAEPEDGVDSTVQQPAGIKFISV